MAVGTTTAIITSAILGATTSSIAANRQENIADEQQAKLDKAERERKAEAERIARETRPEEEAASISFGSGQDDEFGSVSDFLVPKKTTTALGTTGSSGLGFSV